MPRSRKINLEKVLASLNTTCPKCGFTITPDLVKRVDFERIECPRCGNKFSPTAETCPYSEPPFGEFTNDHIFPGFIGGRKSIRVCRDCNSVFGHSFEAKAAVQIKRMQVFISHSGLDLSRAPATWPSALVIGDRTYDLKSGPEGVQYELARPIILRDGAGRFLSGEARSRAEAEQIKASLLKKGKAKEVKIEESPGETLDDILLSVDWSYNADLHKFSAKLACNMAIAMGRGALIKNSGIARYLHGGLGWSVRVANTDTSAIRKLRPALSHTVYAEFGRQSHAFVILFGGLQIYVPLPPSEPGAILGFLDPITGEESFSEVEALNLAAAPEFWTEQEARSHLQGILSNLSNEAKERGAKRPPNLHIAELDLGPPASTNE